MTVKFKCDSCGNEFDGRPWGYDGDYCTACYVNSEVRMLDDEIQKEREKIKRAKQEIVYIRAKKVELYEKHNITPDKKV